MLPANGQLLRPMAMGGIWFLIQLLSTGSCPSAAKRGSAAARQRGSAAGCNQAPWLGPSCPAVFAAVATSDCSGEKRWRPERFALTVHSAG
jgi:hypothetical protein